MARNKNKKRSKKNVVQRSTRSKAVMEHPMQYIVISGKDHMKVSEDTSGILESISLSGLVFQTPSVHVKDLHLSYDETPHIRNKLAMEIHLPGRRKLRAIGEVSWYEKSFVAKDPVFYVGVSFTEIHPEDRQTLKDHLVAEEMMADAIALDSQA